VQHAHPTRGGPSCTVPIRQLRVTGPLVAIAVTPCQRPGDRSGPTAVGKKWSTGGRAEQASNTARGTLERKRTCGFCNIRTAASAEIAAPPRHREMLGPVGPFDPRRPAPPRTCFERASAKSLGRNRAARTRTAARPNVVAKSNTLLQNEYCCCPQQNAAVTKASIRRAQSHIRLAAAGWRG